MADESGTPKTGAGPGAQASRDTATTLIAIAAIGAYLILSAKLGAGFAIVVGILGVCGLTALGVLRGPVGRAWARRIDRGTGAASDEELEQLHARLAELEAGQSQIAELEERVDFAERLLTQGREEQRLPEQAR